MIENKEELMQIEGLDEMDNRILEVIADHARMSYSDIGEKVGLSRVAVKNRMDQMEKNGVIRGYRTEIAAEKVPESIPFYLDIETDPQRTDEVLDQLARDSVIRRLYLVSGNCRIHAEGLAPNRNTLQVYTRYLYRSQKGVLKLACSIILSTLKDMDGGIEYVQRNLEQEHLEDGGGQTGAH